MTKITDLSKEELLGIIFNNIDSTRENECYCGGCGKDYVGDTFKIGEKEYPVLIYVCDSCNKYEKLIDRRHTFKNKLREMQVDVPPEFNKVFMECFQDILA